MDPNVQQPQVSLPQQELPEKGSTSSLSLKILLPILGVIVVVLGLIGGAYYVRIQRKTPVVSNEKSTVVYPTKIITPTVEAKLTPITIVIPTPDVPSNWKIYISKAEKA